MAPAPGVVRSLMGSRILIADDCPTVRRAIRSLLERDNHRIVAEADNGVEAVRLTAESRPDVVILDLSMPVMNGFAAAREIHRLHSGIALILLSNYSGEDQIVTAMRAGMLAYVAKSDAGDDLLRAVREVCQGATFLSVKPSRVVLEALLAGH